jgi:hypothetical protein
MTPIRTCGAFFTSPDVRMGLDLRRKGWTTRAIHNDLLASLDKRAITYRTVARYLHDVQINFADATPASHVTSPHLGSMNQIKLSCEIVKNSHSLQFDSSRAPHIHQLPRSAGSYLRTLD